MNKYYVIVPGALLLMFLGFERDFQRKRDEEEKLRAALVETVKAEEDRDRLAKQQLANQELQKRTEERERQEHERAEKKRRGYEAMMATLKEQADTQTAEAEKLAQDVATLGAQLAELRTKKETTDREAFDLAREVALQRVDRRNAEMEIQRTTKMVAARLTESPWASPAPSRPAIPAR